MITGDSLKQQWPLAEHTARLRRYDRYARLYRGDHKSVFVEGEFRFRYDEGREYVCANLFRKLTNLLAGRLFSEGVRVTVPGAKPATQEFLQHHLYQRNSMETLNLFAAIGASYRGDACYKVRYDGNEQRIVVETFSPAHFFPELDPLNQTRCVAANLDQVLRQGDRCYLWRERHELRDGQGWITNRLFRLEESSGGAYRLDPQEDGVALTSLPETTGLAEEYPTGVDDLLVVHVPNMVTEETGIWGLSDYEGLLSLQGELNHRLTQRAEVLDKFVDPAMYGPEIHNEDGEVDLSRCKYFEIQPGETAPVGLVVWDAQLDAVENELRELRQDFAASACINLTALLPREGGAPVSGRALRLDQMTTQDTVKIKQRLFGPALQRVFSLATKLAQVQGVRLSWQAHAGQIQVCEPEEIVIDFSDGLPSDRMEEIDEQVAMVQAGLQSRREAIRVLHGVSDLEAEQRIKLMGEERHELVSA